MKVQALLLIAFCVLCGGTLLTLGILEGVPGPVSTPPALPAGIDAARLQEVFADTVAEAMPGVVKITSQKKVGVVSPVDYYRGRIEYKDVPSGEGSGFFIDEDGYILTNYHVVRNQDSFFVTASDGAEFDAKVVGVDPPSDLALLKIDADRKFHALAFADIGKVRIGHWAIAIGAPFSLSRTVTTGVVSGMNRRGVGLHLHENYIQTDTSINPGNSGGPLLNLEGKVIGVNDFILSPSGGSIGISFAISADLAKHVAEQLMKDGQVLRPWLGAVFEPLEREEKARLKLESGVVVSQVFRDSPAAKVLRRGDVILEAGGEEMNAPGDLQSRILSAAPGDELPLKFSRAGELREERVKLEPAPRNWFRRSDGNSRSNAFAVSE